MNLLLRAKVLAKIRTFFAKRRVLEVETPLLLPTANPSPYLNNFSCGSLFLQSSPEFAMKKLLARGSGDIYQICKAFRKEERGRLHNPEFTILEWYRTEFNHHDLMDEAEKLLSYILKTPRALRFTYAKIYKKLLNIKPACVTLAQLKRVAKKNNLLISGLDNDKNTWLELLFTHLIEPKLAENFPTFPIFIYDFPEKQAMLARVRGKENKTASRFELYYKGIELANGFHELNDPQEQRRRFNSDLTRRKKLHLPAIPIDEELLSVLPKLPNCSGVALGVDRLLLLKAKTSSIDEVLCL